MNTFLKLRQLTFLGIFLLSACGRDKDPIPVIPPSDGSRMTLQGGQGEGDAINAVYVDLSAAAQNSVGRDSWTLGFYSGPEFRVILNNQHGVAAIATGKSDIAAVDASNVDIDQLAYGYTPDKLTHYDDSLARLDLTVIDAINADESANKVYILNTIHGTTIETSNVWKIKVNRSSDGGYQLQYGLLDDDNVQTLNIPKDPDYNFTFASLSAGKVNVEPKKTDWDFVWTKSMYYTSLGSAAIPYFYSDLVFINHLSGVSATEIIFKNENGASNGKPTYDEFNETHLSGLQFSDSRNVISSHWRVTTGGIGVLQDRFYLIRDQAGNIYKLKFLVMGVDDSGKRGYPELEYKLVKSN